MIDSATLAAYIASRVCHDIVSPASSVSSAIDLLDEPNDAEMREQANSLLRDGAAKVEARLKFLRYAFGSMGLADGAADIHEAKSVTEKFVASHKPSVEFDIETDHLSYSHVRLMMNAVMLAMESLPRGGVITVRIRNEAAGMEISATAKGMRAVMKPDTRSILDGGEPAEGWSAQGIQPLFARMIGDSLGATFSYNEADESVTITASGIRAAG